MLIWLKNTIIYSIQIQYVFCMKEVLGFLLFFKLYWTLTTQFTEYKVWISIYKRSRAQLDVSIK